MDRQPIPDSDVIVDGLLGALRDTAAERVPRFLGSMPTAYFQDTDQAMRLSHIKAIIAAEASGLSHAMTLRSHDGATYTFISDKSYPGQLAEFVRRLPREQPLQSAKIYTAADGSQVLDILRFGSSTASYDPSDPQQATRAEEILCYVREHCMEAFDEQAFVCHLRTCASEYLLRTPVWVIARQYRLVRAVRERGQIIVDLADYHEPGFSAVSIGLLGVERRTIFERFSEHLGHLGIDIHRAYLDSFSAPGQDTITLVSLLISQRGQAIEPYSPTWSRVEGDLRRLVYLDDAAIARCYELPGCDLQQAEVLQALTHLVHQSLVRRDRFAYARDRIAATLQHHPDLAMAVGNRFLTRFDPKCVASEPANALLARIGREVELPDEQVILQMFVEAVESTQRSNVHLTHRSALALRIDPGLLGTPEREHVPYGVFYVYGNGFDGFHVRFRDIARGGMRIVRPLGNEQYVLESERHYDEAYGLAYAQQLKNKDIPEGGAKGVILALPGTDPETVGRAFADALLDMVIPDPAIQGANRDYFGNDELLYLGPDENVSNRLIEWTIERARQRGYPLPDAFMSSKPGAGINHKAYGVTSEGVTVFLEHALRAVGIDPRRQPFSIVLTGGPDGDVAGNEIRILHREFGDNVRVLGIADGSGSLEDPDGLHIQELLRLVDEARPVACFRRQCLGPRGRLTGIDEPAGVRMRNSLHNRVVSDAFIPAGGRPRTIDEGNWRQFLTSDGRPSSRVIVEGANLFLTPEARTALSDAGVVIIKDSSANKCGVICSSYEIIASMLLDEPTFLKIKARFVQEVLEKLRMLADAEARALFRERRQKPHCDLPALSIRLSLAINRAADAVAAAVRYLEEAEPEMVHLLVQRHMPPVLREVCGDTLLERLPRAYLERVVAASLASRIVYREGMAWFEEMSERDIIELARRYLRAQSTVEKLVESVDASELPGRERIAELLDVGGVAASLKL